MAGFQPIAGSLGGWRVSGAWSFWGFAGGFSRGRSSAGVSFSVGKCWGGNDGRAMLCFFFVYLYLKGIYYWYLFFKLVCGLACFFYWFISICWLFFKLKMPHWRMQPIGSGGWLLVVLIRVGKTVFEWPVLRDRLWRNKRCGSSVTTLVVMCQRREMVFVSFSCHVSYSYEQNL